MVRSQQRSELVCRALGFTGQRAEAFREVREYGPGWASRRSMLCGRYQPRRLSHEPRSPKELRPAPGLPERQSVARRRSGIAESLADAAFSFLAQAAALVQHFLRHFLDVPVAQM